MASGLVANLRGDPLPPAGVQEALAALDPRYSLRWVKGYVNYWGVCEQWRESDPRRARIQQGLLPADGDFDLLGMLPADCSADQAYAYLERKLRRVVDPRKEAAQMQAEIDKHNADVQARHLEAAKTEAGDHAASHDHHDLAVLVGAERHNAMIDSASFDAMAKTAAATKAAGATAAPGAKPSRAERRANRSRR